MGVLGLFVWLRAQALEQEDRSFLLGKADVHLLVCLYVCDVHGRAEQKAQLHMRMYTSAEERGTAEDALCEQTFA